MAVSEAAIASAAASVVSDKRGRTAIATIICAVLMIFMMPLIVYMGITSNMKDIEIDTDSAVESIVANMSSEEEEKLSHLETVMKDISSEFKSREMPKNAKKAQAIYCCALYDIEPTDSEFVTHWLIALNRQQTTTVCSNCLKLHLELRLTNRNLKIS